MALTFKFVAGNTDIDTPLGILNIDQHENLMVGTDCQDPANVDVGFNWHFRVGGLTDPDVYPRRLDGPIETYGIWFNPSLTSGREDPKCDNDNHWPMNAVQTQNGDEYTWDIYVVPYLGGSVIEGIDPPLPIPGTQYILELAQDSSTYGTILSDAIPLLFPVFGYGRDSKTKQDFYPADFGYNYRDTVSEDPPAIHPGVDIVPLGLFSNGEPPPDWDEDEGTDEYIKVYAVVGGTVQIDEIAPGVSDITIYTTDQDPSYPNMQFTYAHVVPLVSNGSTVCAGRQIATIINGAEDSRANGVTHLHFEVARRVTSEDIEDPRQFIYPGLTPMEA